MSDEEINALDAGLELDEHCAKAMGWAYSDILPTPKFSKDIEQAWRLVGVLIERGCHPRIVSICEGWSVRLYRNKDNGNVQELPHFGVALTAPLAICRAFLKAVRS